MKRLMLATMGAMILVGVQARPPTDSEAIWIAMIDIASSENEAMHEFVDSGISEAAAARVRNYCKDALEQMAVFAKKLSVELCALKGAKRGAIADQLEKMGRDTKALEENLIANLGVVLSAEEESQFRDWALKYQSNTEIFGEDALPELAYQVRTGSVEANPVVDRVCHALEDDKQAGAVVTEPD